MRDWLDRFEDRHPRLTRFAKRWGPLIALAAVLLLVWFGSYNNRRDNRASQLQNCTRSLFERTDSIRSDDRQRRFFSAAATVREATWSKDTGRTGTQALNEDAKAGDPNAVAVLDYRAFALEAGDSAVRRAKRLLGANGERLGALTEAGEPTAAARAEALHACETVVPPVGFF